MIAVFYVYFIYLFWYALINFFALDVLVFLLSSPLNSQASLEGLKISIFSSIIFNFSITMSNFFMIFSTDSSVF
jgi:hypothetical protein